MTKEKAVAIAKDCGWEMLDLREMGYDVPECCNQYRFFACSPAGEDFNFFVEVDADEQIPYRVYDFVNNFSIDEHVNMWLYPGSGPGTPTVSVLVEDAVAIKKMLEELSDGLCGIKQADAPLKTGTDLDAILREHFGCKRPFFKRPKVKEHLGYGFNSYDYITVSGSKAYAKLVSLIYDLGAMLPELVDADEIVEALDEIVEDPGY